MLAATLSASGSAQNQTQPQRPSYPVSGGFGAPAPLQLPAMPVTTPITPNGAVVEDVIARVNDQIITRSEYERSEQQLLQESQQHNLSAAEFHDRQQDLLRDMIDQQILLSKGKELGISGDAETMRELDDLRKKNNFADMEALQKAAEQQGVSFEDFKQNIRNQAITQQVVRDEVGRHINLTQAQEQAYYAEHGKEFEVPEQIHLSEILVPTAENATDAQIDAAQTKANDLEAKLKAGAKFPDVAKSSSGGPTASAGGDLGDFKRGMLGDVLEKATFPLAVGGFTAPIRTRQGFVILRVDSHQAAGTPPLTEIEPQVQEAIYVDQLQPALRVYLTKARDDAYVDIKPGFVDTGSVTKKPSTVVTAYAPPPVKKKVVNHQKAEQERAAAAQAQLAAERAKVAEHNAQKAAEQAAVQAAKNGGSRNVSKPVKAPKIRREKVRFGQAPRTSLPSSPTETAATPSTPLQGQAPGVAMALADSTTTISTGTSAEGDADPLAPKVGPVRKTRFSQRETETVGQRLETKVAKTEERAAIRPVAPTPGTNATEQQQAAPLGLNGDTVKKKPKTKRGKGETKERLKEAPKPADGAQQVAPTINPALATTPGGAASGGAAPGTVQSNTPATRPATPSADSTTLPPANEPAPGALPQGQPIPATTSAQPNQPATPVVPH